ncbi:collagen-binding domain-containing protein [Glycomyces albidus]|uniref:collagen-binding domain-containing protein n=1 Tax=Glycomyces albidus TaxID=2656774 RepID=UPI001883FA70|nr:collagen-binding domain-containing protein [Glycomyces albidus]
MQPTIPTARARRARLLLLTAAAAATTARTTSADLFACNAIEVVMTDSAGNPVQKGEVASGQQIRITLTEGGTNVLNVTGEDLNNMADLVFVNQPTEQMPLLVNVDTGGTGGELDWEVATQAGISGAQAPYILWNFADATRLNIASGDSVEGSIFAPDADLTDVSSTNAEGQIVARNASFGTPNMNGGEIHYFPFAAELECETDTPTESPTASESPTDIPSPSDSPTDSPSPSDSPTDSPSDGSESPSDGTAGPSGSPSGGAAGPGSRDDEDPAGPGDFLTATGDSVRPLVIAAGALLAAGAVILLLATRRRKATRPE